MKLLTVAVAAACLVNAVDARAQAAASARAYTAHLQPDTHRAGGGATSPTLPSAPQTAPHQRNRAVAPASRPALSHAPTVVFGSLGLLALGVGSAFGYLALEDKAEAEDHCSQVQRICDSRGVAAAKSGRTRAALSLAALTFGGAFVATSLWFYADNRRHARWVARFSPSSAQVSFATQF